MIFHGTAIQNGSDKVHTIIYTSKYPQDKCMVLKKSNIKKKDILMSHNATLIFILIINPLLWLGSICWKCFQTSKDISSGWKISCLALIEQSKTSKIICLRPISVTSYYRPRSREIIELVASVRPSVRPSIRPFVCQFVRALLFEPFDLWPWFFVWGSTLTLARLGL